MKVRGNKEWLIKNTFHKYLEECGEWVNEDSGDSYYILSDKSSPYYPSVFRFMYRKMVSGINVDEICEMEFKKIIIKYSEKNNNFLFRYVTIMYEHTPNGSKKTISDFSKTLTNCVNFTKRFKEVYEC